MSPQSAVLQSGVDPTFALMGQSSASPTMPQFNAPNQKQPPFPQHILHQLSSTSEMSVPLTTETSHPPMLSLDATPDMTMQADELLKTSPAAEQPAKLNAWGMAPSSTGMDTAC